LPILGAGVEGCGSQQGGGHGRKDRLKVHG
jgi:hypothetical protein